MLHPFTRFFINAFYVVSLLVLALSVLFFLARALLHEDGSNTLSNLINDNLSGVELTYDNVAINFSLQDVHFSVEGLNLTIGEHSIRSANANFWLSNDKLQISLPEAEINIAAHSQQGTLATKIALPIELSAINAQINIAAATLTLQNTNLFLKADAEQWLLNIDQRQEQQNIHLRAAGDNSQRIRVYSELHNITAFSPQIFPLPLSWSEASATVLVDIEEAIQYRAVANFNNLHSDSWQVTTATSHWRSHGYWQSADSMQISIIASAVTLTTPQALIADARLTAVLNSRGTFPENCSDSDAQCTNNVAVNFTAAADIPLPHTPTRTVTAHSHGHWQMQSAGEWQLHLADLNLTTADGSANMTVSIQALPAVTLIAINGRATAPVAITAVAQYVPTGAVREWLDESLRGGTIQQAMFSMHSNSDFTPTQTTLQITTIFAHGTLAIADGWQPATELAGTLVYNGDSIAIVGDGTFDNLPVASVRAHIPQINNTPSTLFLDIISDTAALTNYLQAAQRVPLIRAEATEATAGWQINGGRGILSLTLAIPLEQPKNTNIHAHLALQHAAVAVTQFPLYQNINGDIYFDNDNVRGDMSGIINNAINAPRITVSFNNNALTLNGIAETALLLSLANLTLAPITGDAAFTVTRTTAATIFYASLDNTEIDLPYPLNKKSGTEAKITLHSAATNTAASYQSAQITLNLQINDNGMDVAINESNLPPASSALNVHGNLTNVNWVDWFDINNDDIINTNTTYRFSTVRLTLYNSELIGTHNDQIIAYGSHHNGKFSLDIISDSMSGSLLSDADSLVGRFSHLRLLNNEPSPSTEETKEQHNNNDSFTSLHIDLAAATLIVASITLGAMHVTGAPQIDNTDNIWLLNTIKISSPDITLIAGGSYENKHTFLSVHLHVNEIPTLLSVFNIPPILENGRASVLGNIAWHGSPLNFNLAEMKGKLLLTAEKVQYADDDITTDVVNFLALFSPTSLFSLGFTELGKRGILFDTIQGKIALDAGSAQLAPFNLENSDTKINMQGDIDYINQQYDLYGEVFPGEKLLKVGSTIGLGTGLLLLNPASFVAGSILGKVFEEPIAAIGRYDYTITGSWDAPVYERNKKEE